MADVRALLKAKRQEIKINHPYATYSSTGQLRCTICGLAIKQASMWEGHLGSKAHRVNVTKKREAELLQQQKEKEERSKIVEGKRKAIGDDETNVKKRKLSESDDEDEDEDERIQTTNEKAKSSFPDSFFSDPSRALPISTSDDGDTDNEESIQEIDPSQIPAVKSEIDMEWERFKATVVNAKDEEKEEEQREAYARATVFAEPNLKQDVMQGMPVEGADGEVVEELVPKEETEEEKQQRKEREEKELIMDRLLEEERAQEDADSRVGLLKAKLDALKKQREAKKAIAKGKR